LAISIANSGKRALLIDADFRRPRIHRLFGLDNSCGISSVIEGKSEIVEAVQKTDVENLSIMSCGPRPDNPSELLSSRRFDELLGLLREQYDLVVVDTPPVLAVTDPLNVVSRVDGVLLVLRLTKSARTTGRRALESLDGMGANVLGIVINGVGNQKGGYGYGYGKYGYGYGGKSGYGGYRSEYGYDYRYTDGYGDDHTYYEDDEAVPASGRSSRPKPK
jgi:capsular exopolysaccharide synthesis family protein